MANKKLLKSKKAMKMELQLAEIGCIKSFLKDATKLTTRWGFDISGMKEWEAEVLANLSAFFEEAEKELYNFQQNLITEKGEENGKKY